MRDRRLRGLYAITPAEPDEARLLGEVKNALAGGVRLLQFRDKSGDTARRLRVAQALRALCDQFSATLIINDDVALATSVGADGVHLGSDDGDLVAARRALPAGMLLGASCYADLSLARAAAQAGADYVAFGAVYPSPTKPLAVRAPLSLFAAQHRDFDLPVCAIGGITLASAPDLVAAGADMLAVISDLFGAADIAARAHAFQQLFQEQTDDLPQPATH